MSVISAKAEEREWAADQPRLHRAVEQLRLV